MWPEALPGTFAKLIENFARPLRIDGIRHLHRRAEVRTLCTLRPPQWITRTVAAAAQALLRILLHLLGHLLGTLAHLFERLPLLIARFVEIALLQRIFGLAHRIFCVAELFGITGAHLIEVFF